MQRGRSGDDDKVDDDMDEGAGAYVNGGGVAVLLQCVTVFCCSVYSVLQCVAVCIR